MRSLRSSGFAVLGHHNKRICALAALALLSNGSVSFQEKIRKVE